MKKNTSVKRNIEFLFEVGSLRNVSRGWRQHLGMDCASVLEHTVRVAWLALILARMEKAKNEEKVLKMALVHDIAETRISDLSYVQKVYVDVKDAEARAVRDIFAGTGLRDFEKEILREFDERKSPEAKIVKDADNLDIDLELKELEERGSRLASSAQWRATRKMLRDKKFFTKSAKKLWDELQKSDVSSWHKAANKFLKIPTAGR